MIKKIYSYLFKCIVMVFCTTLISSSVFADQYTDGAKQFIVDTANSSISIVRSKDTKIEKGNQLSQLFERVMDINWITKYVTASHWRSMSDQQRQRYTDVYKKYLVASYVPLFSKYNGQKYKIGKIFGDGSRYDVAMIIEDGAGATPIEINYVTKRNSDGSFKVRDIIVEDISMLITQREEFEHMLSKNGVDHLITTLESKVSGLSNH